MNWEYENYKLYKSNKTPHYNEIITHYKTLANNWEYMQLLEYGPTDSGEPLHLIVVDIDKDFNPVSIRAKGKSILFINNGIHPGEPDGIDACLKLLNELCTLHGETYPDLFEINTLFTESALDLSANMRKKEQILFPFIKKINEAHAKGLFLEIAHFGTLENQILLIKEEHDTVGQRFKKIAALTKNYTAPADTCNTYKVTFAMLKEFERDLQKHIHLENNILFPKSVSLEKSLDKVL